ncbi:MAG: hypothetical protein SFV15_10595 [Polyangiaceae bacterium]|nr:hypothetical protein [Polyangiaceae bacterium]
MTNQSQTERKAGRATEKSTKSKQRNGSQNAALGEANTSDGVYGLISILYHALQGADTYAEYVEDAEESGDEELITFFEACRDEEQERAEQAKSLLATRLRGDMDGLAQEEEEG